MVGDTEKSRFAAIPTQKRCSAGLRRLEWKRWILGAVPFSSIGSMPPQRHRRGFQANVSVIVVLSSTRTHGRFPVIHDPMDREVQIESIVYLIHDDQRLSARVSAITQQMGLAVLAVDSAEALLESYDDGRESCLITDLNLHECTGLELLHRLEDQSISVPPIFVTSHADVKSAVEVMRCGAITVLEDPFEDDDLRDVIEEALRRDASERSSNLRRHTIKSRIDTLSEKERQVMEYVVDGNANKIIAKRLSVSIRTVESRRHAVFQKMQVNSLAELVRCVVELESGGF